MRHMPTLTEAMTAFPVHVEESISLIEAEQLMEQHQCHHLPVMNGDEPVGILSSEDLKLARTPGHDLDQEGDALTAGDMCQRRFAQVDMHTRLDIVLQGMADGEMSAVLIMRHGKLAGILTAEHACGFMASWLRKEYLPTDDPDIA